MNWSEKTRMEMGSRVMGTRKRDPGSKRDQEFWCRVVEKPRATVSGRNEQKGK